MISGIEKISDETRNLVNQFFIDNWFSTDMSIRGEIIDGTKLDGFLVQEENVIIGLITYTFFGDICEIVSLDSKKENIGIGSALVKELEKVAKNNNCKKMRLITTNDMIEVLTDSVEPRKYWNWLKNKLLREEEFETSSITRQLKLVAKDGKNRMTDVVDIEGIDKLRTLYYGKEMFSKNQNS